MDFMTVERITAHHSTDIRFLIPSHRKIMLQLCHVFFRDFFFPDCPLKLRCCFSFPDTKISFPISCDTVQVSQHKRILCTLQDKIRAAYPITCPPLKFLPYNRFHHMPEMRVFILCFFYRISSGLILPEPEDTVIRIDSKNGRSIAPADTEPAVTEPFFCRKSFGGYHFFHHPAILFPTAFFHSVRSCSAITASSSLIESSVFNHF